MNFFQLLCEGSEDTVWRFIDAWHGRAASGPTRLPPGRLPEAVRRLRSLAEVRPAVVVQNQLVDDPEWARDGDRRAFYAENQGVFVWATEAVGADPVVWGRFIEQDERWQAEREPLSRFLLQIVAFEAIMGAPCGAAASWTTLPQLESALGRLERLPWGSWRWPAEPGWFYAGTDVLAFACPNGPTPSGPADRFSVWIGARSLDALAFLRGVQDITWDREPG
jgi:hypothetical protein